MSTSGFFSYEDPRFMVTTCRVENPTDCTTGTQFSVTCPPGFLLTLENGGLQCTALKPEIQQWTPLPCQQSHSLPGTLAILFLFFALYVGVVYVYDWLTKQ